MFRKRVKRFHVDSEWLQYAEEGIQQIECSLQEIQFENHSLSSWVKGLIKRRIHFSELNGRSRVKEDKVYFTINIGIQLPSPLPELTVDLHQESFIFKPGKIGENKALLKHEFVLVIQELKSPKHSFVKFNTLLVDAIVKQGKSNTIVSLPIHITDPNTQPRECKGRLQLEQNNQPPIINGTVSGVIIYLDVNKVFREKDFSDLICLFIRGPSIGSEQTFHIHGEIVGVSFHYDLRIEDWIMELIIEYQWFLTEMQSLVCQEPSNINNQASLVIKTPVLLNEFSHRFMKNFSFPFLVQPIHLETMVSETSYYINPTQGGFLLTATISLEVTYIESPGLEKFQELQTRFDEFIADQPSVEPDVELQIKDFHIKIAHFFMIQGELKIFFDCSCRIKKYLHQMNHVIEGGEPGTLILAKQLLAQERFSLMDQARLRLPFQPQKVEQMNSKLLQLDTIAESGWLTIKGILEITISFVDLQHVFHQESFKVLFEQNYIWSKLPALAEIKLRGELCHDFYEIEGANILYHYLIELFTNAFQERVIQVATIENRAQQVLLDGKLYLGSAENKVLSSHRLIIEGELSIVQPKMRKILESKAYLSDFYYQQSGNAILIKGVITDEIHYLDHQSYLQKEKIHFPFWKFIPQSADSLNPSLRLIPDVLRANYTIVRHRLLKKDRLRARFELKLDQT